MIRDLLVFLVMAAIVVAGWFFVDQAVFVDPDGASLALGFARAVGWAGAVGLALVGAGGLVRRLTGDVGDAVEDAVVGLAVASVGLFAVATTAGLGPTPAAVAVGLGLLALAVRPPSAPTPVAPWLAGAAVSAAAAVAGLALLVALAPPIDTDELYWHLAAPERLLRAPGLPGGMLDPVASRPLPLQVLHAVLLVGGGASAVKVFHVGAAVALGWTILATVHENAPEADLDGRGRGAVAGLALAFGSWTVLDELGLAHDNLVVALTVAVALRAALRGAYRTVGLALGSALAIKYTSVGAALGVGVVGLWFRARGAAPNRVRRVAVEALAAVGLAALVVAPWPLRNVAAGLHPLFPYAGWPDAGFVYVWTAKYGFGHGALDLLRAPWDLAVHARTDRFQAYLGRIHPMWLVALPPVAWRAVWDGRVRAIALGGALAFVAWFEGMQWVRHLVPALPLFAVAVGLTAARLPARGLVAVALAWALLLPPQAVDLVRRAADGLPVLTGQTSAAAWRAERVAAAVAAAWVNTNTPKDARIALLFTGEAALIDRDTVLSSVEDHTPSRWWIWHHQDRCVAALRDVGVRYVLVQRTTFLDHTYPFVPPAQLENQLKDPPRRVRDRLAAEATKVFESGRYSVWDLGPPLDATTGPR